MTITRARLPRRVRQSRTWLSFACIFICCSSRGCAIYLSDNKRCARCGVGKIKRVSNCSLLPLLVRRFCAAGNFAPSYTWTSPDILRSVACLLTKYRTSVTFPLFLYCLFLNYRFSIGFIEAQFANLYVYVE